MRESYSETNASLRPLPGVIAEPRTGISARDLIAQLLPGVDADGLLQGLAKEREGRVPDDAPAVAPRPGDERDAGRRELRRVRAQFALGEAARHHQHAFNNPLTALMAELQLLELDTIDDASRAAVGRILELARRLVALSRQIDVPARP